MFYFFMVHIHRFMQMLSLVTSFRNLNQQKRAPYILFFYTDLRLFSLPAKFYAIGWFNASIIRAYKN